MKILAVNNLYPPDVVGGYEMGCRQAVEALLSRGHRVRVLTSSPRSPVLPEEHVHRTMRLADVYHQSFQLQCTDLVRRLTAADASFVSAHNVSCLMDELQRFDPDVVYLWHLVGLGGLGLVGALHHLRVPWVWHIMDAVPLCLCSGAGGVVPVLAQEFSRQISGTYLACSSRVVKENQDAGVALNGDVEILPNWVVGRERAPRARYCRAGRLRMVTAAGWLGAHKGIDIAIEATARLRDLGFDNLSLDIFGRALDGGYQALIQRLSLDRYVALQGMRAQAELAELYQNYDVFLFPTWEREPFGFAPLEAAAQGCVSIITQDCGLAEWLVDRVHCLKAARTAPAFVEILQEILTGKLDLRPLGDRSRHIIWRDFHLDVLVERIEAALLRASRRGRAGAGTVAEVHRMAAVAEKLTHLLIQEACAA